MNYDQFIERYHFLISEDSKSITLMHSMEILLLNLSSITEDFVNICVNIVWMWDLDHKESWVPKNWGFETAVLKTLGVPWIKQARRSNHSILREISPEYSLEGLMLKLKLQYSDHLMWRTDSLEKTLMLGKIEGRRRRGWQRMSWLDGIPDSMDMSMSKVQEMLKDRKAWNAAVHVAAKSWTLFACVTEVTDKQ